MDRRPSLAFRRLWTATVLATLWILGCSEPGTGGYQGYVEGEFVHVAPGVGGRLERLFVRRGQDVEAGAELFQLEAEREAAGVRQADEALAASEARLADLGTGLRSTEIEVSEAQLAQARAEEEQSASQLARDTAQLEAGGISRMQLEASEAKHAVDVARVRELEARLAVAELSARPDQIRAQTAQVAAARAAADQARWQLAQKHVVAARAGAVVDTLYREGEWVPAGSPVVRMLPPANVKVRFFVPQPSLGLFPVGQKVTVRCDGESIDAAVSYVSSEPEYTPPILYSNENRAKLVFMIEADPAQGRARELQPGQPVEVLLP